ncbi:hypothetical protein MMC12_000756 [Toensbergia leucococca]|nr:hypothetical protein [Toensbergia leucococca]
MAKSKKSKVPDPKPVEPKQTPSKSPSSPKPSPTPEVCKSSRIGKFKSNKDQQLEPTTLSEPTDFESFYLQKVTAEFADDLDRVRNAEDFRDKSLPLLINALKQGASIFSEEERRKVMGMRDK